MTTIPENGDLGESLFIIIPADRGKVSGGVNEKITQPR
jgi:hypothetical protein